MAEGFEQRQVVQGLDPAAGSNQPARQLGTVGVGAPRGGDTSAVGASYKALTEVAKFADKEFKDYLDNKQIEDTIEGEVAFAQGETEADLLAAGANRNTLNGFRALRAKTAFNEWKAGAELDIENSDFALDPDMYRSKLQENLREVLPALDVSDPANKELVTEFLNTGMQDLVRTQMIQNTRYMQDEYGKSLTSLLYSEANSSDKESLQEVVSNIDGLSPTLSPEARQASVVSAVSKTLQEGNFALYEALGGLNGLRAQNVSEETLTSISKSYERAQTMQESSFMSEIDAVQRDLVKEINEKGITFADAKKQILEVQEQYNLSDAYVRGQLKTALSQIGDRNQEQLDAAKMYDPEFLQEVTTILTNTSISGMTDKNVKDVLKVADKFNIGHDDTMDLLERTKGAHNSYTQRQITNAEKIARKNDERSKLEQKATALLNSGFDRLWSADEKIVDAAVKLKRQQIIEQVQADNTLTEEDALEAIATDHVDFLMQSGVKDKTLVAELSTVDTTSPTNPDGSLKDNHKHALKYMQLMRDSGMPESMIKTYNKDSYEYLSTAADLMISGIEPLSALEQSYEMTRIPEDKRTPRTTKADIEERWPEFREAFFDNMDPSILGDMFLSNKGDGTFDEVLDWQMENVVKNSPELDRWIVKQADVIAQAYPQMSPEAVMKLAGRGLSKWDYVMGNLVPPREGKSISEMMGVDDMEGNLQSNSALIVYMRDNMDRLFPEGTDTREWWESKMGHWAGQKIEWIGARLEDITLGSAGAQLDTVRSRLVGSPLGSIEAVQRYANDIKMLDVAPVKNGQLLITVYKDADKSDMIGLPIPINAKDVGKYYKSALKNELRSKGN